MEIPKGWVQVTWSNPKRVCSQCGSRDNETGWRHDPERDRGLFLCVACGPTDNEKVAKPVAREVSREGGGAGYTFRRGRPAGSKNKAKRAQ